MGERNDGKMIELIFVASTFSLIIASLMADLENNGGGSVELSSNGQSSQTNLVEGRQRSKKPRQNRNNQAESSLTNNHHQMREEGKNFLVFVELKSKFLVDTESAEIKYNAAHVIHLFVPVSLCMLVVIISMQTIGYFTRSDGVYL